MVKAPATRLHSRETDLLRIMDTSQVPIQMINRDHGPRAAALG